MRQHEFPSDIAACVEHCRDCQSICLSMATGHFVEPGSRHPRHEHLRIMLICARTCGLAADVMATGVPLHQQICAACADICDACITSCRDFDGMEDCIEACERCKECCEAVISK